MLTVGTDAYIDLEELTAYATAMGQAMPDDDKAEAAARYGAKYLDVKFEYSGAKTDPEQELQFPRDNNPIPQAIKDANCELAFKSISGISLFDDEYGRVLESEVKAGPVTTATKYSSASERKFSIVEALVKPYLAQSLGGSVIRIERG